VLIVRLSAIGDVVVTTPVTRALRQAFPAAYLAWVVESRAADVLEGNPYLDAVIRWDRKRGGLTLREAAALRRLLRPHRFDLALDFQGNLRSALAARLSGARIVVGRQGVKEGAALLYHRRVPREPEVLSSRQRSLNLLRSIGVESGDREMVVAVDASLRGQAEEALRAAGAPANQPYCCLVPATTWAQKHWFAESWAVLATAVARRFAVAPVVLGGPTDTDLADQIAGESGVPVVNLAGRTSLRGAAAVLQGARFAVAVDTALMHIAVAVGTPTVGLCGASWWYGFQDYAPFELVREPLPCSPCLHHPTCEGRHDCMRAITPQRVLDAIGRLIPGGPRATVGGAEA
jgi:heptosyltransferase-1